MPSGAFWRLILYEGTRTELDSDGTVFSRRPRAPIPLDRNPGVSVCVVNSDENIRTRAKTTGAAGELPVEGGGAPAGGSWRRTAVLSTPVRKSCFPAGQGLTIGQPVTSEPKEYRVPPSVLSLLSPLPPHPPPPRAGPKGGDIVHQEVEIPDVCVGRGASSGSLPVLTPLCRGRVLALRPPTRAASHPGPGRKVASREALWLCV